MIGKLLSRRRLWSKQTLVIIAFFVIVTQYLSPSSNSRFSTSKLQSDQSSNDELRDPVSSSVFHSLEKKLNRLGESSFKSALNSIIRESISNEERQLLQNWNHQDTSKLIKCSFLYDMMYKKNPNWSNSKITKFYSSDEVDNMLISLMGESLRLYDYCFLQGGLDTQQVFNSNDRLKKINSMDLIQRTYPFLNSNDSDDFWPDIINLRDNSIVPKPEINISPVEFKREFWKNWQKHSAGKGISVTMKESDEAMFVKLLKVLDYQKNVYPIQIITFGNELSEDFINRLSKKLRGTKQQVYIVNCTKILDKDFSEEFIVNFLNKWLATIFNTFEEVIFIDIDSVPYVNFDYFFDLEDYKKTGIQLYKDRLMLNEKSFEYCMEMFREVEPTKLEETYMGTNLLYDSTTKTFDNSEFAQTYQNFFRNLQLHNVDSGVVVVNKVQKLSGLLFSFMLNLDGKARRCVYGDKELFWIGQLFAGQNVSIDPNYGGTVGPVAEFPDDEKKIKSYQICASQISHVASDGKLLWTNGGLKTCKIDNCAESDFNRDRAYFEERYKNQETLSHIYMSPLKIEGMIIPDSQKMPWAQIKECSNYLYCAVAVEGLDDKSKNLGNLVKYDKEERDFYNSIINIWNTS